jgi:hypothetical protein
VTGGGSAILSLRRALTWKLPAPSNFGSETKPSRKVRNEFAPLQSLWPGLRQKPAAPTLAGVTLNLSSERAAY